MRIFESPLVSINLLCPLIALVLYDTIIHWDKLISCSIRSCSGLESQVDAQTASKAPGSYTKEESFIFAQMYIFLLLVLAHPSGCNQDFPYFYLIYPFPKYGILYLYFKYLHHAKNLILQHLQTNTSIVIAQRTWHSFHWLSACIVKIYLQCPRDKPTALQLKSNLLNYANRSSQIYPTAC